MTPEEALKKTTRMEKDIKGMMKKTVAVGYPKEKVGSSVYPGGDSVLDIATHHEYGAPAAKIPRRSILRVSFSMKAQDISKMTVKQLALVLDKGLDPEVALGRIGTFAQSIAINSFRTNGYGTWPDIKEATKKAKGRSSILITNNILRGSLTWLIR